MGNFFRTAGFSPCKIDLAKAGNPIRNMRDMIAVRRQVFSEVFDLNLNTITLNRIALNRIVADADAEASTTGSYADQISSVKKMADCLKTACHAIRFLRAVVYSAAIFAE